jgi:hypothetical protein
VGFFGPVVDAASARSEATLAMAVCWVKAAVTLILYLVSRDQVGTLLYMHPRDIALAAAYALLGWGLWRLKVVAALLALVLFVAQTLPIAAEGTTGWGMVVLALGMVFLAQGVVATYRYRKISRIRAGGNGAS